MLQRIQRIYLRVMPSCATYMDTIQLKFTLKRGAVTLQSTGDVFKINLYRIRVQARNYYIAQPIINITR